MIKKILVALDGSEPAGRALDLALDMAEKYSADILLLSVVQPVIMPPVRYSPATAPSFPTPAAGSHSRNLKDYHKRVLAEALTKAKKAKRKLKVSTKLAEGRPSDKIIETAKEEEIDIIVMGSRGLGGIKQFFLGSVSDRVADEAPCPVLIIK